MAQFFSIHPTHPQARLVRRAADIVRAGGLVAYPTDSCYALGCKLGDAKALDRLRRVRGVDERHHLTLMCRDLSEIANYALVDDARFQLLKRVTPGSYTFILRARRQVPRRSTHPRRKTIGVRVPGHPVAHARRAERFAQGKRLARAVRRRARLIKSAPRRWTTSCTPSTSSCRRFPSTPSRCCSRLRCTRQRMA